MKQSDRQVFSSSEIAATLKVESGDINPDAITVYSMVRNEIYYLPSFLKHYRSLGAEQFILLDDHSSDATHELLKEQKDCIILSADYSYGDPIRGCDPDGKKKVQRAGIWYKQLIPRRFLGNQYVLYADADEFLLLPSGFSGLKQLYHQLNASQINAVSASLLELYPEHLENLLRPEFPDTLEKMIALYPYYDHRKLVEFGIVKRLKQKNPSPTHRLLEQHGIKRRSLLSRMGGRKSAYVLHKTPIFRNSPDNWLVGSHHCLARSSKQLLLCLLHMKWTFDLTRRTDMALSLGSYAKNSERYQNYQRLFDLSKELPGGLSMLIDVSRKYSSLETLEEAKIIINALKN